ncbi:hypothetical protein [Streptobacillus moniliformis]|uniref:hypothetical protein n=1 Tax=Streptobacillus moniliformis TaxID=34105 RepID=UPI0001A3AB2B|nr:hypothetical protein [Streptobacillus moniliformis]AVL42386.1 hypothetical protein CEP89_00220 [Streptobacillus moniliformis]SQA13589.1 Uncharacterised protein [Streptobacillus moniliformis]
MRRERTLRRSEGIINLRRIRKLRANLEKVAFFKLTLFMLPLIAVALVSIVTEFNLTNIARENYANIKGIERVEKEIDSIKSELMAMSNVIKIQKESKELGFIYNEDVKYIK